MTTDFIHDESPAPDPSDAELEQWLSDAYDAPAVPRSLLKRIDLGVEEAWGVSPRLAPAPLAGLKARWSRGSRWTRAASAASALAAVIVVAVVLSANSPRYAWADVLTAIARHGVIQIETSEGVRWLSLSEGMLGERTTAFSRLIDLRRNVVLVRASRQSRVRVQSLPFDASSDGRDRLLASFLLGGALSPLDSGRLVGLRVVDERWERHESSGRDEVRLLVRFENDAKQRFALRLTLDPDTHLPLACEPLQNGGHGTRLPLSYPAVTAAELRQREFPPDLAVVHMDGASGTLNAAPEQDDATQVEPSTASESDAQALAPELVRNSEPAAESAARNETESLAATLERLRGAASNWPPVAMTNHSSEQVLRRLDSLLSELWRQNQIEPAALADDEELLRRVYLDLVGRTPSVSEARAYLNDRAGDRYERLVDRLLKSPDHASHLATVWRTFLIPEGVDLAAFGGVEAFDRWLADRFASNDSYDEVVQDLLLAEGRLSRSGPLLFYSAAKLDPDQLASRTARVFLGMRLECAQCHDHPFEPWTQQDFWGFAAFFAQISRPRGELESVSTVMRVRDVNRGEVMLPETETVIAPRFLDGVPMADEAANAARRRQLAGWLVSAENPYFARAAVNRVCGQLFGKGIVDPVDDFGQQHPPKSPELLELLAGHFIGTGFDLREVFRTAALSRAYRLSSSAATVDERRADWFAQMNVKMLSAEQVYDCITVATLLEPLASNPSEFQVARFGNVDREAFLQQFRTPVGRSVEYQGGIPQALTLMNGALIENATGLSSSGLLNSLEAPFFTHRQRIEVLYLATLSRHPRPEEWELLNEHLPADATEAERKESLADLLWALLNSAEFTMNH